jgi:hypothetical protein
MKPRMTIFLEQQDPFASPGQQRGDRRSRWAAADHEDVKGFVSSNRHGIDLRHTSSGNNGVL